MFLIAGSKKSQDGMKDNLAQKLLFAKIIF